MYAYSDAVRVTFIENSQEKTINLNPENLEDFKAAHPDYVFISTEEVRDFFPMDDVI